jgi:hypothetical protein
VISHALPLGRDVVRRQNNFSDLSVQAVTLTPEVEYFHDACAAHAARIGAKARLDDMFLLPVKILLCCQFVTS